MFSCVEWLMLWWFRWQLCFEGRIGVVRFLVLVGLKLQLLLMVMVLCWSSMWIFLGCSCGLRESMVVIVLVIIGVVQEVLQCILFCVFCFRVEVWVQVVVVIFICMLMFEVLCLIVQVGLFIVRFWCLLCWWLFIISNCLVMKEDGRWYLLVLEQDELLLVELIISMFGCFLCSQRKNFLSNFLQLFMVIFECISEFILLLLML